MIALAKQNFYSDKIEHTFRNGDCCKWWSFVNTLSGRSSKANPIDRGGGALILDLTWMLVVTFKG